MILRLALTVVAFTLFSISVWAIDHTALVIVDMQDKFFKRENNQNSQELKTLLQRHIDVIQWSVLEEIPILTFEYQNYGPTTKRLRLAYENHPHANIIKNHDGGFYPGSDSYKKAMIVLANWGVDRLIVIGINGGACVKNTIQGALTKNFIVYTAADVVSDFNTCPPRLPDSSWWYNENNFYKYSSYKDIIKFFDNE